jgi:hypothetical protein
MRIRTLASTASIICAVISLGISPSQASGLLWQVEKRLRLTGCTYGKSADYTRCHRRGGR